ncbi:MULTISPECIES: hypothetical protein [unclassified Imperialibacter]|uniref:hypothetical protein n=1 Tax=unclassified Imperialibacter TaxID=2629706 RepID=UPI00125A22FB|nr:MULTISPECIES: hypothetical protein [unclassified Imperialibacter]CAD5249365.1 conserved hypothetical protein [Imperialibacter sp. 89]CAD5264418.1 conserved hypothetical protein [Imperialibacter sp. 75]VVT06889.1 conserved hypothetical protein [Imperialibacter sp. EC-SDR9]
MISFISPTSELPDWANKRFVQFSERLEVYDQIEPTFIELDLDGDQTKDVAIFVREKSVNKTGVLFLFDGDEERYFLAGAGDSFGTGGDSFEWADRWEIFLKSKTHQTTFLPNGDIAGTKTVELKHPAISIREDEGSGGLIYFDGKKFIWIHQGD